ncbi:MAG: cysteine--tRNA ligase, partial [Bradyrhizobium sp.]
TEHIAEMRTIIERLVASGFAYVAEDHVLFSPQAMNAADTILPRYGALAKRSLDEMIAGARVDVAPYKRDATDFVLWKPSKLGEPSWPTPAGIKVEGRPGWHVECSAMSDKLLWDDMRSNLSGEGLKFPHQFDIHGGGVDLVFPHHENELAQTCCAFHNSRMANFWMHNGFLQVEGEKMSKSLGNFVTIHELLADWPGEVLRLNMLKTHYRSPIDWTLKGIEESKKTIDGWYEVLGDDTRALGEPESEFIEVLADDLNTSGAITRLHAVVAQIRGHASGHAQIELKRRLKVSGMLLGLLSARRKDYLLSDPHAILVDKGVVNELIKKRSAARARKDFKESDRIRDELAAMGVVVKDSKDGTTWEIAR